MTQEFRDDNFVAHGYLYLWQPELIWLHAISDLIIALAFFAIPITLITLIYSREKPVPFSWILQLCALSIFLCGICHLLALVSIWHPIYYIHGLAKAVTAAFAICTALILLPVLPLILKAINIPSDDQDR